MTFKMACADFTFPLLSHDQALQLIALLGFRGVDIGLFEGRSHLWPSTQFVDLQKSAKNLRTRAAELGLQVADVFLQMEKDFRPFAMNHPDSQPRAKARQWFLQTLDYATACQCHHVTALPGVHFETEGYDDSFSRSVDELAWRVEQAQRCGIVFGTEPHVGSIVDNPTAAMRLVKAVPGLTLTLDYTHFMRAGLPDSSVEPLLEYAEHFHVRGAAPGRLQVSYDKNQIDYKRIAAQLKRRNYQGWIGIEYIWIDWEQCNECDNISETVRFQKLFGEFA